jgi:hypothetical protein
VLNEYVDLLQNDQNLREEKVRERIDAQLGLKVNNRKSPRILVGEIFQMGLLPPKNNANPFVVVFAGLAGIAYTYSLLSNFSADHPGWHIFGVLLASFIICPLYLRYSPDMVRPAPQLFVLLIICALDWFSFFEDKSRFSEKPDCIFGNCRTNAHITGQLAHILDVVAILMLANTANVIENAQDWEKGVLAAVFGVYVLAGSFTIKTATADDSQSDLRGLSDESVCCDGKIDIMPNVRRGALNDIILLLGVLCAWQEVFSYDGGIHSTGLSGGNPITSSAAALWRFVSGEHHSKSMSKRVAYITLNATVLVAPTIANILNAKFQHGASAKELGIPHCALPAGWTKRVDSETGTAYYVDPKGVSHADYPYEELEE